MNATERMNRVLKYFDACGWKMDAESKFLEKNDLRVAVEHIAKVCELEDTPERAIRFLENEIDAVQR